MAYYDKAKFATTDAWRVGRLTTHLPGNRNLTAELGAWLRVRFGRVGVGVGWVGIGCPDTCMKSM